MSQMQSLKSIDGSVVITFADKKKLSFLTKINLKHIKLLENYVDVMRLLENTIILLKLY